MKLKEIPIQLIEKVENLRVTPFQWLLLFSSIVIARNFLEQFGPEKVVFNFLSFFLHFPLAYVAPILALSLILALLTRERIEKVTKLMLFAWFLTLVPPLIDLAVGMGTGSRIAYLYVDRDSILRVLLNFFNPAVNLEGTTAGIRIEAFLGCILACTYVFFKTRSAARVLLTFLVIYFAFMLFFTLPYTLMTIVSLISPRFGDVGSFYFESGLLVKSYVDRVACSIALLDIVLVTILLLLWARLYSRALLKWVLKGIGRFASIHFSLAVLFGILLGFKASTTEVTVGSVHFFDLLACLALVLSVLSVHWVSRALYQWSTWAGIQRFVVVVVLALGLALSGLVGYSALVFSLAFLAFLLLYYLRPLELSRFFPTGPILLGLATVSCIMLGFSSVAGTMVPRFFPDSVLLATLLSCILGFAAKDYSGAGRRGRPVVVLLLFLGFVSVGFVFRSGFLMLAGAVLGAAAAASLALKMHSRGVAFTTYAVFVSLVGFMMMRDELPLAMPARVGSETILHVERGKEFQIGRMYDHAVLEFEQAVGLGWKDAQIFFDLGFAQQERGDLQQSAYWYRKAIAMDSAYVEAYNNLGLVLIRSGSPDSALTVLVQGIERDPGSARLRRNYFMALFDSGRFDELVRFLEGYLTKNPDDYRMRELLADSYIQLGDYRSAEREYRMVLGVKEGYAPAVVGLGYVMANRGEIEEAEKHFLVALQLDPGNVDAMHRLGYIYLDRGDVLGAIGLFREAIKQEPLVANHYDSLGDAYVKAGRYEQARKSYEMAVALDPTFAHPREMLEELDRLP